MQPALVRFGSLKRRRRSFGRIRDERVVCGIKDETKGKIQATTVNYSTTVIYSGPEFCLNLTVTQTKFTVTKHGPP
ncbi:hypothetical protein Hanom_Chr03g00230741 [Helianthus anomalus]